MPERGIDRACLLVIGDLNKRRRLRGLLPATAQIGGTKDRRAEMAGFCRCQQRSPGTRIEHHVVDDMAEKVRSIGAPGFARRIAVIEPSAFARGNDD